MFETTAHLKDSLDNEGYEAMLVLHFYSPYSIGSDDEIFVCGYERVLCHLHRQQNFA